MLESSPTMFPANCGFFLACEDFQEDLLNQSLSSTLWDCLTGLQTMITVLIAPVLTRPEMWAPLELTKFLKQHHQRHQWSGGRLVIWSQSSHWASIAPPARIRASQGWKLLHDWLDSNPQPSILRFTVLSSMPLWLVLQWNLWWETAHFKTTFSETLPWYVHVNVLLTVPLFRPLLLDFFFREGALKRVVPLYHDVCRWSFCLKFNLVWLQV